MNHDEVGQLLGVYALHATGPEENAEVEAHLAECPRCRAEVEAHLEMAAILGGAPAEAPNGLWEKISRSIAADVPRAAPGPAPVLPSNVVSISAPPGPRRRKIGWVTVASVGSVAVAAIAFLGVQVGHLDNQVNHLRSAVAGDALTQLALGPHQTVTLASADHAIVGRVSVTRDGEAVWYWSSLGNLSPSHVYQLWGLSGGRVVSLGLMSNDPQSLDVFKVGSNTTKIMVTAEPQGGTTRPTTPVVAVGNVPRGYID